MLNQYIYFTICFKSDFLFLNSSNTCFFKECSTLRLILSCAFIDLKHRFYWVNVPGAVLEKPLFATLTQVN